MGELGRYFIRVVDYNWVYIKSNTTGISAVLRSVSEIPDFIEADIKGDVYFPQQGTSGYNIVVDKVNPED